MEFEGGSTLLLDQSAGPVYVYVLSDFEFEGSVRSLDGTASKLLLGYLGDQPVRLDGRFDGTLVAQNVGIFFGGTEHHGAFFGKRLETACDVKVVLDAPLLSGVAGRNLAACATQLKRDSTLPEPMREQQANIDLMTLCLAPGIDACRARLLALANADRQLVAQQYVNKLIDAPDHLAETHDITRKVHQLMSNSSLLAQWCAGDADGDRVPDAIDKCGATPPLTPTDENGCATAARPTTVRREVIDALLAKMGFFANPKCDGAQIPIVPTPVTCDFSTITLKEVQPQPSGCETIYQMHVFDPHVSLTYDMAFDAVEGKHDELFPGTLDFAALATDKGARGRFKADQVLRVGSTDKTVVGPVYVSARAINANGQDSNWSAPVRVNCNPILQAPGSP